MPHPARPSPLWTVALSLVAGALVAAFVLLPEALLGDPDAMLRTLGSSLATFWDDGDAAVTPALTHLVDYWRGWHAMKVVICALLLAVVVLLAMVTWARYRGARGRGRALSAVLGTIATAVSVVTAGVLALNIQATVVPLVALFPLVPESTDDAAVERSLTQLRESLATNQAPPGHEGSTRFIVDQVWQYTALNAAITASLAIIMGALAIILLVSFVRSRGDRPTRVVCAAIGPLLGISALGYLAVSAFSVLSAIDASSTAAGLLGV